MFECFKCKQNKFTLQNIKYINMKPRLQFFSGIPVRLAVFLPILTWQRLVGGRRDKPFRMLRQDQITHKISTIFMRPFKPWTIPPSRLLRAKRWSFFFETLAVQALGFAATDGSSGTGDTYLDGATNSNEKVFGFLWIRSLSSQYGATFHRAGKHTDSVCWLILVSGRKGGGSSTAIINVLEFCFAWVIDFIDSWHPIIMACLDFSALINNTSVDVTTDGDACGGRLSVCRVTGISWPTGQTSSFLGRSNDASNSNNPQLTTWLLQRLVLRHRWLQQSGTLAAVNTTYGSPSAAYDKFYSFGHELTGE